MQEGKLKANDELTIGGNNYRVFWEMASDPLIRNQTLDRQMEPAGDRPFAANEDLLLESCDEPVALSEGGRAGPLLAGQQASLARRDGPNVRRDAKTPKEIEHPEALQGFAVGEVVKPIIPDGLSLAPSSESEINGRKRSS